jgi:hypothetical protein
VSTVATSLPSAGTIVAGLIVALVVIAALVVVMRRHRDAFPLLAVFTLPFRLPISTDGRTVNLLIPLYLVVAAGTLTHLLPRLAGAAAGAGASEGAGAGADDEAPPQEAGRSLSSPRWWASPRGVEWLLAIAIGLYALQTAPRRSRTSPSSTCRSGCCS